MNIYGRNNTELIKKFNGYVREIQNFADGIPKNAQALGTDKRGSIGHRLF